MTNKNILIVGDSFASEKLGGDFGWAVLLSKQFNVTNVSSPGIGEYKILQKLKEQQLENYDKIIISHTSPYRVHTENNPLYPSTHEYRKSDILFADTESKRTVNKSAEALMEYFTKVFDPEYYKFVHTMCCQEIDRLTKHTDVIHITNFSWVDLYPFDNLINFYEYWLTHKGPYAHYDKVGSQHIYNQISKLL
jgi:hypothetical protein